jgi:hypothetical protein
MPIIPALRRPRQEDLEFKANSGSTARFCPKKKKKENSKTVLYNTLLFT